MGHPPAIDVAVSVDQDPAAAAHPFTIDVAMEIDRVPREFKRKRKDQDRFGEDQIEVSVERSLLRSRAKRLKTKRR
jgi:hypothetical protein